jgi:hypothetical protein
MKDANDDPATTTTTTTTTTQNRPTEELRVVGTYVSAEGYHVHGGGAATTTATTWQSIRPVGDATTGSRSGPNRTALLLRVHGGWPLCMDDDEGANWSSRKTRNLFFEWMWIAQFVLRLPPPDDERRRGGNEKNEIYNG